MHPLQAKLERVAAALEAGDANAAAAAMRGVEALLTQPAADHELEAMRGLYQRCMESAAKLKGELDQSFAQAGALRRAHAAYFK